MKYRSTILIDHGRLNYELKNYGAAVVGVPGGVSQGEIDDAVRELKTKYDNVGFDVDGDILINA